MQAGAVLSTGSVLVTLGLDVQTMTNGLECDPIILFLNAVALAPRGSSNPCEMNIMSLADWML